MRNDERNTAIQLLMRRVSRCATTQAAKESEHAGENTDEINVETENSWDVFVGRDPLMNHMGVENRIRAEDKATKKRINQV